MAHNRILVIGGYVPWHPRAQEGRVGGGQIIAYKVTEALARQGYDIEYVAIAPPTMQRPISWGEITYRDESFIQQFIRPEQWDSRDYPLIHLHPGVETAGLCLKFGIRPVKKQKIILGVYGTFANRIPRSIYEFAIRIIASRADRVIVLSEFSKNQIAEAYGIPRERICVMYGGVDPAFFIERGKKENDHFLLLFTGRLDGPGQQKGLDVLLEALPAISRRHPVQLHIAGAGPGLEYFQKMVRRLKIEPNVRFLGFTEYPTLADLYHQADLFVLPTRRESFGLVLAEAMAAGLPVVSTSIGAVPEVVSHGENGVLIPPDDPEACAEAVNALLDDPVRMREMGRKGRERAVHYFTWEKVAERVAHCYREIL
jgi:glycosyltransferase involved in cell wall biosynthesis